MRDILLGLAHAALDAKPPCSQLELGVRAIAGGVALWVSDDGAEEAALGQWKIRAQCGRPLLCAVADRIARRLDGSVEVSRNQGRTRIELKLPSFA